MSLPYSLPAPLFLDMQKVGFLIMQPISLAKLEKSAEEEIRCEFDDI